MPVSVCSCLKRKLKILRRPDLPRVSMLFSWVIFTGNIDTETVMPGNSMYYRIGSAHKRSQSIIAIRRRQSPFTGKRWVFRPLGNTFVYFVVTRGILEYFRYHHMIEYFRINFQSSILRPSLIRFRSSKLTQNAACRPKESHLKVQNK